MTIANNQTNVKHAGNDGQPRCRVSGLPICQDITWKNVDFGRDFSISLSTIGSNVLLAQPKGYITLEDVKKYLDFIEGFFQEVFKDSQTVFGLLDGSGITGMSLDARRYYIEQNKAVSRFGGFVFFNASLVMKVSIRLGKHLNILNFDVEVAGDYNQAIKMALQMMEKTGIPSFGLSTQQIGRLEQQRSISGQPDQIKVRTDPDWILDLDGFSVHYEIIDDDIFHAVAKGHLREKHMPYVFDAFENVFEKTGLSRDSFYYVNGVSDLEGMTWKARMQYIDFTGKWYKMHPFRLWFIYGTNRFMRTATQLGSYFVPYEVRIVDDLSGALDIIYAHKARTKQIPPATYGHQGSKADLTKIQVHRYVDEMLQFLGGIDWDSSETIELEPVDSSHPFKPVFEAIQLIKMDLDQLLLERKHAEIEREKLEVRLQQAQKMEAIGTLAGGVAHDLNNILSGLVSYPELLLMDLPIDSPYRKPIEIMKRSGERAAVIVQDLLTLARRSIPEMETLNTNQIVAEYMISPEMENLHVSHPQVQIETELAPDLLNIKGSSVHLSKMIMNLLSNAMEAMPQGGRVIIQTENCPFDRSIMGYEEVPAGEYIRKPYLLETMGRAVKAVLAG